MQDRAIVVENLTRKFGDFTAVNRITFDVKRGEIFGFLGANGAGKTTAIKMLNGLLVPTSGEARVSGLDVYTESEKIKKSIGYMSQKFSLYDDLTVKENIRFFGGIYGIPGKELQLKSERLIESSGLSDVQGKQVGELPLGWKQKLAFSIATLHRPAIVFLDEPTSGVDPVTRRQFWEMIYESAESGTTVFVTTHYMDEAEYCDRISIMVDGKIEALDTPVGLKESHGAESIEEVFIKLARSSNNGS